MRKNETPEEAALRELNEEAGVRGKIVRPLAIEYKPDLESRIFYIFGRNSG